MGWLGLPIDMMNCVFVLFIIGIGEDYSVFLATSKLDEWRGHPPRIHATSASVMISALTTIFGFAVLIFARHPVLFSMGTTVLLGMACAFAATLVITPLCMDLLLFKNPPRGAPRWWHPLGTLWVFVHLGGSQIFLYYALRPILKIISPRTADEKLRRATRWMARGVVKWMPFGKLEFQNITPQTFSPTCIVISNHQSAVDVMLVVSLPADVRQTAKKRVFDEPMLGIGCKLLGHIMVEPNDPELTMRRCREKLAEGASVHFYPEGTRSPDGFVQRFHRGAFELAVESNQEILPVVLCDTNTAMPRDAYWFEPYHATVRALPRVTPQNFDYSLGSSGVDAPLRNHRARCAAKTTRRNQHAARCPPQSAAALSLSGKIRGAVRPLENENGSDVRRARSPSCRAMDLSSTSAAVMASRRIGWRNSPTNEIFRHRL